MVVVVVTDSGINDRDKWRKYVHGVANPRIEDGLRTEQNRLSG